MNANPLPPAPAKTEGGDVTLLFAAMSDGDEARGFVPGYYFWIFDRAGRQVGHLHFRVGDTEHIRSAAGHIGFEIRLAHRGRGYAGKACLALAPWISTVSDRVLITADPDNFASIRTIERLGGRFLDEVAVPPGDPHFLRGSTRKRRYEWTPGEAVNV